MAKAIRVHSVASSNGVPNVRRMEHVNGASIVVGSILVYSSGEVTVGGANPSEIVGVALAAADSEPGWSAANSPSVVTGREQKIPVVIPDQKTVFRATLTNGSSATVTPTVADVGAQYGLTAYSGIWTVDKANVNDRVEVVGFDAVQQLVFFKFLDSVLSGN